MFSGYTDYDVVLDTLHFDVRPQTGDSGTLARWERGWGPICFRPLLQSEVRAAMPPAANSVGG